MLHQNGLIATQMKFGLNFLDFFLLNSFGSSLILKVNILFVQYSYNSVYFLLGLSDLFDKIIVWHAMRNIEKCLNTIKDIISQNVDHWSQIIYQHIIFLIYLV